MLEHLARQVKNSLNLYGFRNLRSLHSKSDEVCSNENNEFRWGVRAIPVECISRDLSLQIDYKQQPYCILSSFIHNEKRKQRHQDRFDGWEQLSLIKWTTTVVAGFYASSMLCLYARRRQNFKRWEHMEQLLSERYFLNQAQKLKDYKRKSCQQSFVPSKNALYRWIDEEYPHHTIQVINDHGKNTNGSSDDKKHTIANSVSIPSEQTNINEAVKSLGITLGHIEFQLGLKNLKANRPKAAVDNFKTASTHHHPEATFNLGICYEKGMGIEKNLKSAMQCYRAAANLGHKKSMYNLGVFYAQGLGGLKKNRVAARECFKTASQMGLIDAKIALGLITVDQIDQPPADHLSMKTQQLVESRLSPIYQKIQSSVV